jgi:hypothetical protein
VVLSELRWRHDRLVCRPGLGIIVIVVFIAFLVLVIIIGGSDDANCSVKHAHAGQRQW